MQNELAEEVRMFVPENGGQTVEVLHSVHRHDGAAWHTALVALAGEQRTCTLSGGQQGDDVMRQKRLDKRAAKLAVYRCLVELTGQTQPWGSLTGVRPVSLLRQLKAEGKEEQFVSLLGVQEEKAVLARRIMEVQDAMLAAAEADGVCLYVGIPFCVTRCSYCSFPAVVAKRGQREAYVQALVREIEAAGRVLEEENKRVSAMYLGGGTPTALTDEQLETVMQAMQRAFGTGCEYTLEAGRPDTITEAKLTLAKQYGVTRLCINPQTMQDKTLERIGRRHTARDIEDCYALAKRMGFTHINCDLIAGLPGETVDDFADTLERIEALRPSSVTCHTLALKRGSKLIEEHYLHAGAGEVARMVDMAREKARALGMEPYYLYRQKHMAGNLENVGYATPDDACLYNVAMMDEQMDVMGLGVGAVGKRIIGNRIERRPNPRDIDVYLSRIEQICAQKSAFFRG